VSKMGRGPTGLRPFALPRPDALSPLPGRSAWVVSCVRIHHQPNASLAQGCEYTVADAPWPIGVGRCLPFTPESQAMRTMPYQSSWTLDSCY
jgi:hypothetical protein